MLAFFPSLIVVYFRSTLVKPLYRFFCSWLSEPETMGTSLIYILLVSLLTVSKAPSGLNCGLHLLTFIGVFWNPCICLFSSLTCTPIRLRYSMLSLRLGFSATNVFPTPFIISSLLAILLLTSSLLRRINSSLSAISNDAYYYAVV